MYPKTDKRRIYQLIDMYLENQISASAFCDDFYYSYDLEIDDETLTMNERIAFSSLSETIDRFSPFKEDLDKYPNVFSDEVMLKEKVLEIRNILNAEDIN